MHRQEKCDVKLQKSILDIHDLAHWGFLFLSLSQLEMNFPVVFNKSDVAHKVLYYSLCLKDDTMPCDDLTR